jgi:hypothetical protein
LVWFRSAGCLAGKHLSARRRIAQELFSIILVQSF